jgi:Raf kinase inhibitor-like YbhB/YbcL family protein
MKNFIFTAIFVASAMLTNAQKTFTLTSSTIGGQATVTEEFNGFGCTGKNKSPQLSWANAPADAKSYAITMYDPDAPTGSGWWHWVVFDIPTSITSLPENAGSIAANLLPPQVQQSVTSYGLPGFGGPCPPIGHGLHQYIITVYALKTPVLGVNANTNPETVGFYLFNNTIAKASLVFYYKR